MIALEYIISYIIVANMENSIHHELNINMWPKST